MLDPMNSLLLASSTASSRFVDLDIHWWEWAGLLAFISVLLVVDLLLVHRRPHEIHFREAAVESSIWISIGLAFTGVIYLIAGSEQGGKAAGEYLSGFLLEKSLSVDNVFVWAVIFSYFAVPKKYQFRVLFWGIFGALLLRAAFIFAGSALISETRRWSPSHSVTTSFTSVGSKCSERTSSKARSVWTSTRRPLGRVKLS